MFLVDSQDAYEEACKFIEENEILAYDTETTGLDFNRSVVIGFGVSNGLRGFYVPVYSYDKRTDSLIRRNSDSGIPHNILIKLQNKKLLMFNASFDARMTKNSLGVDLLDALHADVLLLKHTCDEDFPLDLKGIAKNLWGHDVTREKEDMQESIKFNGGTSTQYYKASEDTLSKYCVQDCLLTFKIFNYYSKELQRQGLVDFYYNVEVLPLYKTVTIPMETVGVRLDIEKMTSVLSEITNDLSALESKIQAQIEPYLASFKTWFLSKEYPDATPKGKVPAWKKKFPSKEAAWAVEHEGYMFNLLSKVHLKKLFFDTLGEEPISRTPTGLPQVDETFIEKMAPKYAWCSELIEFNKLVKIKSTYIERLLSEAYNGRFYPAFMQHRTVSGRYAGDLQQLPRPLEPGQASDLVVRYNNYIREFILPDDGCLLCSADYEQLEPTIFAHTSGDPALQHIFSTGLDFYSEVAIRTENIDGVSSNKKASNYLGKLNKLARQEAKVYALGIAYGMTGYKLQFELNISQEDADRLVNQYLSAFPDLASWIHSSHDTIRFSGQISTQSGRVRHMPEAVRLHASYGTRLLDSLQIWKDYHEKPELYEVVKQKRKVMRNMLNNAVNFQVQGMAASIVNQSGISIAKKLKSLGLKSQIVANVHDEWVLNVPQDEIEQVSPIVKEIMENNIKLAVPLRTNPEFGANFRLCKAS